MLPTWSGSITFDGRAISDEEPADLVRAGIGYVPQVENVFGSLTVAENLRMGGVSRESGIDATIADFYDRFPLLREKRGDKARTLSGGQRQVLALARTLMIEPNLLLINEPSAGLAPSIVEEVFADVQTVNELGTTILMVELNAREGLAISDRGYVLDQGTVHHDGSASNLLDDPEGSRLYLGG